MTLWCSDYIPEQNDEMVLECIYIDLIISIVDVRGKLKIRLTHWMKSYRQLVRCTVNCNGKVRVVF
jgi:hypothetical protein